jgi:hypothetical protein
MDGADALLSSPVVQQTLEREKARPVGVLGDALVFAASDGTELAHSEGRILLVERDRARLVMAIVGKKGEIPEASK